MSWAALPVRRLGAHKKQVGTQPGQLIPADQRDMAHHRIAGSPVKAGGKEGISGNIQSYAVCLLLNLMKTCFPGKGWNLLLLGSGEWTPYFALLVRTAFALPMNLYLAEPTSVLTYALLILFPIPLGGGEWVFKAQLPAEVNPQELSNKLREFASSVTPHKVNIILHILSSILVFYISYLDWSPI